MLFCNPDFEDIQNAFLTKTVDGGWSVKLKLKDMWRASFGEIFFFSLKILTNCQIWHIMDIQQQTPVLLYS